MRRVSPEPAGDPISRAWDFLHPDEVGQGMMLTLANHNFIVTRVERGEDGKPSRFLLKPSGWKKTRRQTRSRIKWADQEWLVIVGEFAVTMERLLTKEPRVGKLDKKG